MTPDTMHTTTATLMQRTMALIYDGFLLTAVLFLLTAVALVFNEGQAIEHPLFILLIVGVAWFFFDHFWRHGGQTLGMRAWRLKLVDDRGGELTRLRTLHRFLLGSVLFGLTYLSIPFDAQRRAVHDRLTATRIVRMPSQ